MGTIISYFHSPENTLDYLGEDINAKITLKCGYIYVFTKFGTPLSEVKARKDMNQAPIYFLTDYKYIRRNNVNLQRK